MGRPVAAERPVCAGRLVRAVKTVPAARLANVGQLANAARHVHAYRVRVVRAAMDAHAATVVPAPNRSRLANRPTIGSPIG